MPQHDHLTLAGTLTVGVPVAVTLTRAAHPLSMRAEAGATHSHAATMRRRRLAVTYYQADDSVFFGEEYVIKGVPGRILWKLLREHASRRRVHFSNRELRLDEALGLPAGNDNLDSRLVSLRRRLARGQWGVELQRVGRGRLHLRVAVPLALSEIPTDGPMRRPRSWPATAAPRYPTLTAGDTK